LKDSVIRLGARLRPACRARIRPRVTATARSIKPTATFRHVDAARSAGADSAEVGAEVSGEPGIGTACGV